MAISGVDSRTQSYPQLADDSLEDLVGCDAAVLAAALAIKMGKSDKRCADEQRFAEERRQEAEESAQIRAMEDKALIAFVGGMASAGMQVAGGVNSMRAASAPGRADLERRAIEAKESTLGRSLSSAERIELLKHVDLSGSAEMIAARGKFIDASDKIQGAITSGSTGMKAADEERHRAEAGKAQTRAQKAADDVREAQKLVDQGIDAARQIDSTQNETLLLIAKMA